MLTYCCILRIAVWLRRLLGPDVIVFITHDAVSMVFDIVLLIYLSGRRFSGNPECYNKYVSRTARISVFKMRLELR